MVQFIKRGPSRRDLFQEQVGQNLGKSLSSFANTYYANKALDNVLEDESMQDLPQSERSSRIMRAMQGYGEEGLGILQNRMAVEQQRQQEEQQQLFGKMLSGKDLTEKETAKLPSELQMKIQESKQKRKVGANIEKSLIDAGYPEETAALWRQQMEAAPQGGQSDVIKQVNQLISRSKSGKGMIGGEEEKPSLKPSIDIPGIEEKSYELDFPELKQSIGRTSADIVKEEGKNREINTPLYADTINSLNALEEDFRDFQQLQEYNLTPDLLPTGLEKWNVDWDTGDLRFKAMTNPETQDYVKIIARLLGRAKEYFPGRVTNFDLNQFRQRFPTLANSPDGRKLITKQLMLANRIAYLKDETLKASIDNYGSEADPVQVRKQANDNYRRLKGDLEKELKGLNQEAEEMIKSNPEEENKTKTPKILEGNVGVVFEGKKGQMTRDQYERALKAGKKVELLTK